MRYIHLVIVVVMFLITACSRHYDKPVKLNGIYIPKNIEWKKGVFETILIKDDTLFVKVTTANQLITGDSITFKKAPGMIVDVGSIKWMNEDKYQIAYRRYFREITLRGEKLPGDLMQDTITLDLEKRDTGFVYADKAYRQTNKFDNVSRKAFELILDKSVPWWLEKK